MPHCFMLVIVRTSLLVVSSAYRVDSLRKREVAESSKTRPTAAVVPTVATVPARSIIPAVRVTGTRTAGIKVPLSAHRTSRKPLTVQMLAGKPDTKALSIANSLNPLQGGLPADSDSWMAHALADSSLQKAAPLVFSAFDTLANVFGSETDKALTEKEMQLQLAELSIMEAAVTQVEADRFKTRAAFLASMGAVASALFAAQPWGALADKAAVAAALLNSCVAVVSERAGNRLLAHGHTFLANAESNIPSAEASAMMEAPRAWKDHAPVLSTILLGVCGPAAAYAIFTGAVVIKTQVAIGVAQAVAGLMFARLDVAMGDFNRKMTILNIEIARHRAAMTSTSLQRTQALQEKNLLSFGSAVLSAVSTVNPALAGLSHVVKAATQLLNVLRAARTQRKVTAADSLLQSDISPSLDDYAGEFVEILSSMVEQQTLHWAENVSEHLASFHIATLDLESLLVCCDGAKEYLPSVESKAQALRAKLASLHVETDTLSNMSPLEDAVDMAQLPVLESTLQENALIEEGFLDAVRTFLLLPPEDTPVMTA